MARDPATATATVIIMLTTTMSSRDLARLNELNIAGLVSKLRTQDKVVRSKAGSGTRLTPLLH
ncbi:hypothetical protein [Hymenobacter rubripertinctus]|uniref:Uncharacterized protein n=1 Tax=Hymenobacter rubripertinctus TaxID=2029981 RepID=A0A418R8I5_9BACT|nr:hypothetical protein [Hymenobacter rubripertinctus]RIY13797.1 hypothetical protein D0T11_01575 [Hymenobacter rubripertinctus]